MTCSVVKMPNGGTAIICSPRQRRQRCACGAWASLQCDWKVKAKRSGTCDRYLCEGCAQEVATEKHLCPDHQRLYENWQRQRSLAL